MNRVATKFLLMLASILGFSSANAAFSPSVVVNGLEWLQPADFYFEFNDWSEVSTVCSITTGECNGSLGGDDITGWTWASVDDVDTLFSAYLTYTFGPGLDSKSLNPSSDTTDYQAILAFFTDFYSPQVCSASTFKCYSGVEGVTRIPAAGAGYIGSWLMSERVLASGISSSEISTDRVTTSFVPGAGGVWLYRTKIPAPATLWLCCASLIALRLTRRTLMHSP